MVTWSEMCNLPEVVSYLILKLNTECSMFYTKQQTVGPSGQTLLWMLFTILISLVNFVELTIAVLQTSRSNGTISRFGESSACKT